jgi:hypothetical protein
MSVNPTTLETLPFSLRTTDPDVMLTPSLPPVHEANRPTIYYRL